MSFYKIRGKVGNSLKSVEMSRGDHNLERIQAKFGRVCGGAKVTLMYTDGQGRTRTLVNDKDVQEALQDSRRRKVWYLECELRTQGGKAPAEKAYSAPARSTPAPAKQQTRAAPAREEPSKAADTASSMLGKYGLSGAKAKPQSQTSSASRDSASTGSSFTTTGLRWGVEGVIRAELNRLRTDPRSYVSLLEQRGTCYDGTALRIRRGDTLYRSQTREGKVACDEACDFLKSSPGVGALEFPSGLSDAGRDIVSLMGPDGSKRPSPDQMSDAISRYGRYSGTLSQIIAFIYDDDAVEMVQDLLVCDGDASRHTRNLLLNKDVKLAGVGLGEGNPKLVVIQFVTEKWVDK